MSILIKFPGWSVLNSLTLYAFAINTYSQRHPGLQKYQLVVSIIMSVLGGNSWCRYRAGKSEFWKYLIYIVNRKNNVFNLVESGQQLIKCKAFI